MTARYDGDALPLSFDGQREETLQAQREMAAEDLWVFGYGSLMWRPGFDYVERQPALLRGYHRALCVLSYDHRGTKEKPGLVLGLDRGGACRGVAFRVAAGNAAATHAYLVAREQTTMVYEERLHPVFLADRRRILALTYTADRRHEQYARALSREQQLAHVLQGVGRSGANPDYVLSTQAHLVELGVHDALLDWLAKQLKER